MCVCFRVFNFTVCLWFSIVCVRVRTRLFVSICVCLFLNNYLMNIFIFLHCKFAQTQLLFILFIFSCYLHADTLTFREIFFILFIIFILFAGDRGHEVPLQG